MSDVSTAETTTEQHGESRFALVFFAGLLLLFLGAMALWAGWKWSQGRAALAAHVVRTEWDASPTDDEPILTKYTLTERSGKPFGSADLAGHVHVVSFFFADCPSTCRAQNQKIAELHREFGAQGIKFLSITCDPETDTPTRLSEYAKLFNADDQWLFLTGELLTIRRIGAEIYQVPVDEKTHTEKLIVVDRSGKIRGNLSWKKPDEFVDLKRLLEKLLAQPAPVDVSTEKQPSEPS